MRYWLLLALLLAGCATAPQPIYEDTPQVVPMGDGVTIWVVQRTASGMDVYYCEAGDPPKCVRVPLAK